MAIDFNEEQAGGNKSNMTKIILIVLAIIVVIGVVFFLNKNKTEEVVNLPTRMFPEININFSFISSGEFRGLQEFDGIPVLPGFYNASDKQIEPENIEIGRSDPFGAITEEEIKTAVLKVILKVDNLKTLQDLETSILSSSLYSTNQKNDLQKQIELQIKILEERLKEAPQGEEIILNEIPVEQEIEEIEEFEEVIQIIEEIEEEIEEETVNNVENEENTNKTKTW